MTARYRVRTCDPYRVKVMSYSEEIDSPLLPCPHGAIQTHVEKQNATVKCYSLSDSFASAG